MSQDLIYDSSCWCVCDRTNVFAPLPFCNFYVSNDFCIFSRLHYGKEMISDDLNIFFGQDEIETGESCESFDR